MDTPSLDSEASVLEYLEKQDFSGTKYNLSRPVRVQAIGGGATNFAYRVNFADHYNTNTNEGARASVGHVRSAVLKYAAEYAVMDPSVPFTSKRQLFEARALQRLPAQLQAHRAGRPSLVCLPELYFFDSDAHVIIMEDMCAESDVSVEDEGGPTYVSLEDACKQFTLNEEILSLMDEVGCQLGQFLACLHQLKKGSNSETLQDLFVHNSVGRQLDVQTTFQEVPDKLAKYGIILGSRENEELANVVESMSAEILHKPDVVIMGDFWYGNIILKVSGEMRQENLRQISIFDWEFATCAPAFVDLAHFASEIWLHEKFRPGPSTPDSANRRALVALFKSYREAGGTLDPDSIASYIGGHICCFLDYANWTADPALKMKVAREGLALLLGSKEDGIEVIKDPILASLFDH